jgi:hypothetical protein
MRSSLSLLSPLHAVLFAYLSLPSVIASRTAKLLLSGFLACDDCPRNVQFYAGLRYCSEIFFFLAGAGARWNALLQLQTADVDPSRSQGLAAAAAAAFAGTIVLPLHVFSFMPCVAPKDYKM